jgi:hypothetical protein
VDYAKRGPATPVNISPRMESGSNRPRQPPLVRHTSFGSAPAAKFGHSCQENPANHRRLHPLQLLHAMPLHAALTFQLQRVDAKVLLSLLHNCSSAPGPSGWMELLATAGSEESRNGLCLLIRDNSVFGGATQQRSGAH